jgi:hypothetical protein
LITTKKGKSGKPELSDSFILKVFLSRRLFLNWRMRHNMRGMLNDLDIYGLPTSQWADATAAYKATGV